MNTIGFLIKTILCLIFWGSAIHAVATHLLLWVDKRLNSEQENTELHPLILLKSFFIEWACVFVHCCLYPLGFKRYKPQFQTNNETPIPILLVHGYLHNQISWLWFRHQLQKTVGLGPVYSLNLYPPFESIETYAKCIQTKIQSIQEETHCQQVFLIGHSMGGLASSFYAEHLATPEDIAGIITIGSPFAGTRVATLGYGKNVHEMMPSSAFCLDLKTRVETSTLPYYSIASEIDNLVIPWNSALPKLPEERTKVLTDHGHLRLLVSPTVITQVITWLKEKTDESIS